MKKLLVFAVCAFFLGACLPQNVQVPQSPLLSTLERKSGLIAYLGTDGNMYISDQGGGHKKQLTEDGAIPAKQGDPLLYYEFPTWSRDGSQLAFIGIDSKDSQTQSKVMVANVDDDSTAPGVVSPITVARLCIWRLAAKISGKPFVFCPTRMTRGTF